MFKLFIAVLIICFELLTTVVRASDDDFNNQRPAETDIINAIAYLDHSPIATKIIKKVRENQNIFYRLPSKNESDHTTPVILTGNEKGIVIFWDPYGKYAR